MLLFFFLRVLLLAPFCLAAETDNFTNRDATVRDALAPLNRKTQNLLNIALLNANRLIAGSISSFRIYSAFTLLTAGAIARHCSMNFKNRSVLLQWGRLKHGLASLLG